MKDLELNDGVLEETLGSKDCARIAKYMYQKYKKAMKPPLYKFLQFEEWLDEILKSK